MAQWHIQLARQYLAGLAAGYATNQDETDTLIQVSHRLALLSAGRIMV
jgi:hypothetical protein